MGLFHKKEKVPRVPLAPNLSSLPDLPKDKTSELPSLPKGLGQQVNNAMVKSAVNDLDLPQEHEDGIQEIPKDFKFEESVMKMPNMEMIPSIPKPPVKPFESKPFVFDNSIAPTPSSSQDPIFVRIDKYQIAKKELVEINKGIKTVEAILNKLGEIKLKEDKEVSQLSESLTSIKTRLSTIDSNVFKKA